MKILKSVEAYKPNEKPIVLSLGFFDGVHLGHQQVFRKVNEYKEKIQGKSVVLTFENHPSTILRPDQPIELICSLDHRLSLISDQNIDLLILLKFTREFSQQSAETFLQKLHSRIPFSHFVLGYDATLGKDRHGNPETIRRLQKELSFTLDYVSELKLDNEPVSSTRIRKLIKSGELQEVEKLLGRKYSIYSHVIQGQGLGTKMGFPTANLNIEGLSTPPYGVYAVQVICGDTTINGVANLGLAPTMKRNSPPQLEVFMFDFYKDLYGKSLEVIFFDYLRPEQQFPDMDALKKQISLDVKKAKQILR
jgi:riboflavin kinase/FMN adenylyltransferase